MKGKNYLIKVLGLSTTPKIFTSILTFTCFPLMVRALGPSDYGTVVYVISIIAVLEALVDFGVSAAAGKAVAFIRATNKNMIFVTIIKWIKLQFITGCLGLLPLLFISAFFLERSDNIEVNLDVVLILVLASWIAISLSFTRAVLTAMLSFKLLAILDASESIIRSLGWLAVAFFFTNVKGFAIAQLFTMLISGGLGLLFLFYLLKKNKKYNYKKNSFEKFDDNLTYKNMLKESLDFLWLRVVTRIFQSVPIILFGKLSGPALVGIVGSFQKMSEILNYPFSIIGNAIAVKSQEVVLKGNNAIQNLWNVVARFLSISMLITIFGYFFASIIANILLSEVTIESITIFKILSITIFTTTLSALIAPMSDYIGALKSRNILMTFFIPIVGLLIFFGDFLYNSNGALIGYVLALLFMNLGYIKIALDKFFLNSKYKFPTAFRSFIFYITVLIFSFSIIEFLFENIPIFIELIFGVLFLALILCLLYYNKKTKQFYFSKTFFEF